MREETKRDLTTSGSGITRRTWLIGLASTAALAMGHTMWKSAQAASKSEVPKEIEIETFSPDGKSLGVSKVQTIVKPDAQWAKELPQDSFHVARQAGTERPFTGQYNKNKAAGIYTCICCGTALFNSDTKFESGTGWPSFWAPISKHNVAEKSDRSFFMVRTEVLCARCDGHLGHVFPDGPPPTGLRYCMNSAAMDHVPEGKPSVLVEA
jgi:peptide-methionine (R)-S-oxide reductase